MVGYKLYLHSFLFKIKEDFYKLGGEIAFWSQRRVEIGLGNLADNHEFI